MKYHIILAIIALSFVPSFVYADTFDFCQGQSFNSNHWQNTVCYESIVCDAKPPLIFKEVSTFESFDYAVSMVQPIGTCTGQDDNIVSLILPYSYTIEIIDSDFDYTVFNQTVTVLGELPQIILHKDIDYDIIISSTWYTNTDESKYKPFIEDDYGNLIDAKTPDHTLYHNATL